ncbi:U23-like protein [Lissonota sp. PSUC_FEM 10030012]|nr:U23-like protein [Lissonota sp. PSUC_FEM 10030012]
MSSNSGNGEAVLSDAYLIKVMHLFFELSDWKMTCNEMLTKVLDKFSSSIARGCFEDVLQGFLLFLSYKKQRNYRRNSKDITYLDFQVMLAGLIVRFANDRTLKDVMDDNSDNEASNCPGLSYNMHLDATTLSMMGTSPYANKRILPRGKVTVIEPKQAAILVFLFDTYYSNNSSTDDSAVQSLMEQLEHIDEVKYGSVKAAGGGAKYRQNTNLTISLMTKYADSNRAVIEYIKGQYSKIFSMLNECFLRYDFLNTNETSSQPRYKTKELMMHYFVAFMGLPCTPSEVMVWSTYVNHIGAVTLLDSLLKAGALNAQMISYILSTSFMVNISVSAVEEFDYKVGYRSNLATYDQLVKSGKYHTLNPYDARVTRNNDHLLMINPEKLVRLKYLHDKLIPHLSK